MHFSWSEEELDRYKEVAAFAQTELGNPTDYSQNGAFPYSLWKRCAEFGVLGWAVDRKQGGSGFSVSNCAHLMEALGYGCADNGLPYALGTQMWGIQRILLQFGSDTQIDRYLAPMLSGDCLASFAINESVSGSDALALGTTAKKTSDGYILNGVKTVITLSPIADFSIVLAVTDADAGRWGISAFVVDAETPGYVAHENELMMGLRSIPFGQITLDQCLVPDAALLGKPGAGASIFAYTQGWERSLLLAPHIGTMQRLLEQSVGFAKNRFRDQQPIGKYQAVSHRIADMMIRLETSRLLLYKTAWLFEHGKQNLLEAAIAKTYLSESFVELSHSAILTQGGEGYMTDTGTEQNLRDAISTTIYGGTVDVQRNIIASLLGL